jgi:hypothetical protein
MTNISMVSVSRTNSEFQLKPVGGGDRVARRLGIHGGALRCDDPTPLLVKKKDRCGRSLPGTPRLTWELYDDLAARRLAGEPGSQLGENGYYRGIDLMSLTGRTSCIP